MKCVEIWYNNDNIQMLCISNASYSTVTQLKMHAWSDESDW